MEDGARGPGSLLVSPAGLRRPVPRAAPRSLSCLAELDRDGARDLPVREPEVGEGRRRAAGPPDLRPIMRRRARSLPSSPERRKKAAGGAGPRCRAGCSRQHRVRFADALGLELTQVKVFNAGDDPAVPLHVLSRLSLDSDLCCGGGGGGGGGGGSSPELEFTMRCLVPDFPQPADEDDFFDRLRRDKVRLERVTSSDLGISGTVRVLNVAFEKQVSVRYTFNRWRAQLEAAARWRSSAGEADLFSFCFPVPPFLLPGLGSAVQFAVRYRVGEDEYWDNNGGRDYSLVCRSHPLRMPRECEESWIHFI
ncbi:protein phosphatase 1 regulatory subunit 3D [Ornithorhynchus anatinus]|uniref:protein phosphatase 1 regulatory subunit 3D n=1 Tax=Ornithorhynchus anatinus TaxID=9258 RepID=UPI0010A8A3C4|nr:protein phosphatase 1 regulatory subunit 3D [Ornithorhynchus anatinus]